MTQQRKDPVFIAFFLLFSAAAWLYIWLRASTVQFSIDEAATFFMYIQPERFLPPGAIVDANNHLLNSFLTWCCYRIMGNDPFVLRLPNLISAVVYFYFVYRLAILLRKPFLRYGLALVMIATHFLIEFFAYTRGYGLSMAFLAGALFYMLKLSRETSYRTSLKALVFILLAVFSNLNLLFTGITLALMLSGLVFINRRKFSPDRKFIIAGTILVLAVPGFYFLVDFSFNIRQASGFYYGASDGFWPVTIKSLTRMITGIDGDLFGIYAIAAILGAGTFNLVKFISDKNSRKTTLGVLILLLLLLANWLGALILNRIWMVNFQEDRAAMHLVPIFFAFILFSLDNMGKSALSAWQLASLPLLILIPLWSYHQISLKDSVYGTRQQVAQQHFEHILDTAEDLDFPPVVSAYQIKRQPWSFLNLRTGGTLNQIYATGFPSDKADYIISQEPLPGEISASYLEVNSDAQTKSTLYQRKEPPEKELFSSYIMLFPLEGNNRFNDLTWFRSDNLSGKDIRIELEFSLQSPARPLEAAFVAEVFDKSRKNLLYEAIDLDQVKPSWNPGMVSHVIIIEDIPEGSDFILLYFWNKKEMPFVLSGGRADFYLLGD